MCNKSRNEACLVAFRDHSDAPEKTFRFMQLHMHLHPRFVCFTISLEHQTRERFSLLVTYALVKLAHTNTHTHSQHSGRGTCSPFTPRSVFIRAAFARVCERRQPTRADEGKKNFFSAERPEVVHKETLRWQHIERKLHKKNNKDFFLKKICLKEVFLAEFSFRTRLDFGVKLVMNSSISTVD